MTDASSSDDGLAADSFVGHRTPARTGFAVADDREEQLFERRRRMFDAQQLAVVPRDHLLESRRCIVGQVAWRESA